MEGDSCEVGLERETKKKGRKERKKRVVWNEKKRELAKLQIIYIYLFTFEEIKVDKYCLNDT